MHSVAIKPGLLLEHLPQGRESGAQPISTHGAEPPDKPSLVESADLLQQDETRSALETDGDAGRGGPAAGRHWRGDDRWQEVVHFGRRHDQAGACLLNFAADGRIQCGEPYLPARYAEAAAAVLSHHCNSSSPSFPN